ncbi:hypothetical protein LOTGIDRAFT_130408 [Lottia gigantea]|uniref:tRNA-dihydrouridine(16/17) synthase [NAD(P)(+)]-like n=1 Tax=Lottia gigantea TaxID=225164 RepID=V3ZN76_LOTGI|nr:hypothetical protein LOTGIDRAFT_130408 [Lottia gigantea]ESO85782.1 hypothetical protein LOTGIDRAFT_130408 [Lottia gigantea]
MEKLSGYEFWRQKLKSAKYIVAPMVDQSELPWRLLSRKYSAELCYTPMFHAALFVKDNHYRKESLVTCDEDRPLIVQFCANDPETLLKAAQLAEPYCDAIDINLGCPQSIAKKGHYGAFLQDEWDLIEKMVSICHKELTVPITCKIRRFACIKKTIRYAQMLEKAGCQILTIHGRTREQKGPLTGLADWSYIKAVKESVNIPVFANGNIQYLSDVERCLKETNVDGVMTAEGNLHNPALFNGISPLIWDMSLEYLDFAEKYPCAMSAIRGHIFKICHHALQTHVEIRNEIANAKNIEEFREMVDKLKKACQVRDLKQLFSVYISSNLPLPYWRCQPYVRPDPNADLDPEKKIERDKLTKKRAAERNIVGLENISRKKLKRMLKNPNKNFLTPTRQVYVMCTNSEINCLNPRNIRCAYEFCKPCCMKKTREETLDCAGKDFYF